mmetsp:Transcript_29073/g.64198  ORF Transcript_29073/g.64198 Transcript_29073/m.64198 type:complete len:345 (+) Transcript_29073:628-1662(+)
MPSPLQLQAGFPLSHSSATPNLLQLGLPHVPAGPVSRPLGHFSQELDVLYGEGRGGAQAGLVDGERPPGMLGSLPVRLPLLEQHSQLQQAHRGVGVVGAVLRLVRLYRLAVQPLRLLEAALPLEHQGQLLGGVHRVGVMLAQLLLQDVMCLAVRPLSCLPAPLCTQALPQAAVRGTHHLLGNEGVGVQGVGGRTPRLNQHVQGALLEGRGHLQETGSLAHDCGSVQGVGIRGGGQRGHGLVGISLLHGGVQEGLFERLLETGQRPRRLQVRHDGAPVLRPGSPRGVGVNGVEGRHHVGNLEEARAHHAQPAAACRPPPCLPQHPGPAQHLPLGVQAQQCGALTG